MVSVTRMNNDDAELKFIDVLNLEVRQQRI